MRSRVTTLGQPQYYAVVCIYSEWEWIRSAHIGRARKMNKECIGDELGCAASDLTWAEQMDQHDMRR